MDPGKDESYAECPLTKAYQKLLEVERNKDVRKCILAVMPIAKASTLKVRFCEMRILKGMIPQTETRLMSPLPSHSFTGTCGLHESRVVEKTLFKAEH